MKTIEMESPVKSNGCSYLIYLTTDKEKYNAAMAMASKMSKAMEAGENLLHISIMGAQTYVNGRPVMYDCRIPEIFHGENKYGVIIETVSRKDAPQTYEINLLDC